MFTQLLPSTVLKDYDQPLDLEVTVLMITFTAGNLAVQYELKLPGAAGTVLKAGTTNITSPPPQLLTTIEGAFTAMLPQMIAKLNENI